MKNIKSALFFVSIVTFFGFLGFSKALEVPKVIEDNCIIKEDNKSIDTCPQYWQKMKGINEKFYKMFSSQEQKAQTSKDLILYVNKFLIRLHTMKQDLYKSRQLNPQKIFIMDYMIYIIELYRETIQSKINYRGAIKSLYEQTYFNKKQSGLTIQSVSLFSSSELPKVYDEEITIKFSIRNFESKSVSNVEDIYCFSTIGNEDMIFPLKGEGLMFPGNNIANIVGTLNIGDNTLTTIPGEKEMYCMMVYFDENKQEITTPFALFKFTVE